MGGGWFGYVVSMFGCGLLVTLIAGSTIALYGWAKLQEGRGKETKARVRSLAPRADLETPSDG